VEPPLLFPSFQTRGQKAQPGHTQVRQSHRSQKRTFFWLKKPLMFPFTKALNLLPFSDGLKNYQVLGQESNNRIFSATKKMRSTKNNKTKGQGPIHVKPGSFREKSVCFFLKTGSMKLRFVNLEWQLATLSSQAHGTKILKKAKM